MKLSTLNYIHELLKREVDQQQYVRSSLFDETVKTENEYLNDPSEKNKRRWEEAEEEYNSKVELLWKAEEALADFENKEW